MNILLRKIYLLIPRPPGDVTLQFQVSRRITFGTWITLFRTQLHAHVEGGSRQNQKSTWGRYEKFTLDFERELYAGEPEALAKNVDKWKV